MHSRIFQISKEPIDKSEYLTENDYYDSWFLGAIADYVTNISDSQLQEEYITMGETPGFVVDLKTKTLTIKSKEEYFDSKYNAFQVTLERLGELSLEEFITPKGDLHMYNLKCEYNDRYGYYIDDKGEYYGLTTLDELVRWSADGDKFYLGGVVDYHF